MSKTTLMAQPGDACTTVTIEPLIDANEAGRALKMHPVTAREMSARGELPDEDEIIIGKQRNGPLGSEPVTFSKHSLQFVEREGR
jgi:replicative DNA helicase